MNKLEVEGGEVAIKNKNGDTAIIPKNKVKYIESLIQSGKHDKVDSFVSMLPKMVSKAGDGTVVAEGEDPVNPPPPRRTAADNLELQQKYGSGVKHREVYMDFYNKPLPEGTINQEFDIWEKSPMMKR